MPTLRIERLVASWRAGLPRTRGGYAENILPRWVESPEPPPERGSLTQLRLAYTFLHAADLGCPVAAAEARADLGRANEVFWRPELRGWIRGADPDGSPLDETVDTYDQAFGLLALSRDAEASRPRALEALAGLDEEAASPGGGYKEMRNGASASRMVAYPGLRRQNPHMHLLEAFLSWWKADPQGPWPQRAAAMVGLLEERFLDDGGALREYFGDSWEPAAGAAGALREPGHHFEWVWLLNEYRKASGDGSVFAQAERLYDFALRRGLDDDGLAFDAVAASGAVVAGTKLLWPQTEQLKAHLAMYEWRGDEAARGRAARLLESICERYLGEADEPFANRLARDGERLPVPTPSRVLYHVFLALVEAERILGTAAEGSRR